jgi:putative resolvase
MITPDGFIKPPDGCGADSGRHLYRPKQICEMFNISQGTLRLWDREGKIKSTRTAGNQRRYFLDSRNCSISTKRNVVYARVSTSGQKEDLERQIKFLSDQFPNHQIISDIGSGINFKRKGLKTILDMAKEGSLGQLVVTHKDRLCRFGFELIRTIIEDWSQGQLLVLDKKDLSPEQELTQDLISIITVFSSRLYGIRSNSHKEKLEKTIQTVSREIQNHEIQANSKSGTDPEIE